MRTQGVTAYTQLLDSAPSWLEYLMERAATRQPLGRPDGRRAFLQEMLEVAARIPDAAVRDQFADRIAHRARVTEEVVRAEIRKAAVARRTTVPAAARQAAGMSQLKPAERDLLMALLREPRTVLLALSELEEGDLDGLGSAAILRAALAAVEDEAIVPDGLLERLSEEESRLLTSLAAGPSVGAPPLECVRALQAMRLQRERADVQREIDRLQDLGADEYAGEIASLWERKKGLLLRLEAMSDEGAAAPEACRGMR